MDRFLNQTVFAKRKSPFYQENSLPQARARSQASLPVFPSVIALSSCPQKQTYVTVYSPTWYPGKR